MPEPGASPQGLKVSARRLAEEVLNQGDLAVAAELTEPSWIYRGGRDRTVAGQTVLREALRMVRRAISDFHVIVEDQLVEGDRVVQRVSAKGTHDGLLFGLAPTGRAVTFGLIELHRAGPDGRFVEHQWSLDVLDVFSMLQLLGVLPAATPAPTGSPLHQEVTP